MPRGASLDLGFLELDMLARARVVFAHRHLLGQCARVLLGDIEKARVGGAHQLDLDGRRLGHGPVPRKIGIYAGRPTEAAEQNGSVSGRDRVVTYQYIREVPGE